MQAAFVAHGDQSTDDKLELNNGHKNLSTIQVLFASVYFLKCQVFDEQGARNSSPHEKSPLPFGKGPLCDSLLFS